jgi:hypothetical protein
VFVAADGAGPVGVILQERLHIGQGDGLVGFDHGLQILLTVAGKVPALEGRFFDAGAGRVYEVVGVNEQTAILPGDDVNHVRSCFYIYSLVRDLGNEEVGGAGAGSIGDDGDSRFQFPTPQNSIAAYMEGRSQPLPIVTSGGDAVDSQA